MHKSYIEVVAMKCEVMQNGGKAVLILWRKNSKEIVCWRVFRNSLCRLVLFFEAFNHASEKIARLHEFFVCSHSCYAVVVDDHYF